MTRGLVKPGVQELKDQVVQYLRSVDLVTTNSSGRATSKPCRCGSREGTDHDRGLGDL